MQLSSIQLLRCDLRSKSRKLTPIKVVDINKRTAWIMWNEIDTIIIVYGERNRNERNRNIY